MAAVARKTVMRLAPEIGVRIGGDVQHAALQISVARFVEPRAVFEHRLSALLSGQCHHTSDPALGNCDRPEPLIPSPPSSP